MIYYDNVVLKYKTCIIYFPQVGDYTLSVRYAGRVRHFPIEITDTQTFFIGKHNFKGLEKVVKYYLAHPLFYDDHKNPVSLGQPLPRQEYKNTK